jgi:hypothetical protein
MRRPWPALGRGSMGEKIIKVVREIMFQFTFVEGKHTVMNMEDYLEINVVFKSTESVIGREM